MDESSSEGAVLTCRPIGVIRSPHTRSEETPIQPVYASGIRGQVEVLPEYEAGLRDIEGFSHIYLIYAFDRAGAAKLEVVPFLGTQPRGVFATRAPSRPNALGLSLVRLVARRGRVLDVEDMDILDGTPLLDIKPYVGRFDSREGARCGWQDEIDEATARRKGRRGWSGRETGGDRAEADDYDRQAAAAAWQGPAVVFGLIYPHAQAGQALLDVGIGTGLGSVLFARAGLRVFGMDNSRAMLDGARSKGFAQDLREHDMLSVPYPYDAGSFDHAICVGVLQFFADIDAIFREIGRVVRGGGRFGFTVADAKQGEPTSFTAGGRQAQSERDVLMYRHLEAGVRASLKAAGFVVRGDLAFVAFMDAEKTVPMLMKAYVAERAT